jgi:hypothetical protein
MGCCLLSRVAILLLKRVLMHNMVRLSVFIKRPALKYPVLASVARVGYTRANDYFEVVWLMK